MKLTIIDANFITVFVPHERKSTGVKVVLYLLFDVANISAFRIAKIGAVPGGFSA